MAHFYILEPPPPGLLDRNVYLGIERQNWDMIILILALAAYALAFGRKR